MNSLTSLETNLHILLQQYQDLYQQLQDLQKKNQQQREEIMRTHSELVQLRADYNHLETAHVLLAESTDTEHREQVRQRMTNLIAQVDRALAALTQ